MGQLDDAKRYSASKTSIAAVQDTSAKLIEHFKPVGLWYACGLEWIDWLEYEMPHWLDEVTHLYEVIPRYSSTNLSNFSWGVPGRGVLRLQTPEEVEMFDNLFGLSAGWRVAWPAVGHIWDGIEICPNQSYNLSVNLNWYETWDVASGCIWRPSGASDIRLVAKL
jgi:hypothetical protein